MQLFWQDMRDIGMSLTLFTFFDMASCIFLQGWPEVARSQRFSSQGFSPDMVSTTTFVDLGQYVPDFFRANTFQEWG
jgi:hypothetical protein